MPSSQADQSALSEWLELDYFERQRPLTRWRRRLVWSALAIGAILCAGLLLPPFFGPRSVLPTYQSRPLADAHAMFNEDCTQCHTESFRPLGRFVHGDVVRSVEDSACLRCHDGPLHNSEQLATPECATCHREHLGRPVLTHVGDSHCTACHANQQTRSGRSTFASQVSSFPGHHPDFGQWRKDPIKDTGTIRFNHAVHLKPEGILVPATTPPGERPTMRRLDCTSCHQPDLAGRYMQPIQYERHCAECHPLSIRMVGEAKEESAIKAAEAFARTPAPHREPSVVRGVLRERLTEFALQFRHEKERVAPPPGDSPLPGPRRPQPVTEAQWDWVSRELAQVEKQLFDRKGGCAYCHQAEDPPMVSGLPRLAKSQIPERWFPHSRFDHRAHRLLDCASCHPTSAASTRTADVLMPSKETCVACHSPHGGARHDCAECHTFHDPKKARRHSGHLTPDAFGK